MTNVQHMSGMAKPARLFSPAMLIFEHIIYSNLYKQLLLKCAYHYKLA